MSRSLLSCVVCLSRFLPLARMYASFSVCIPFSAYSLESRAVDGGAARAEGDDVPAHSHDVCVFVWVCVCVCARAFAHLLGAQVWVTVRYGVDIMRVRSTTRPLCLVHSCLGLHALWIRLQVEKCANWGGGEREY